MAIKTSINRLIQSSSLYFGFENTWWKVIPETRACRGCDHMVVRFATTYAISAYHHWSCEFESHSCGMYSIQHYVIKFLSDLRQIGGFLWVLRFLPPRYNWNIVGSGVTHHTRSPSKISVEEKLAPLNCSCT